MSGSDPDPLRVDPDGLADDLSTWQAVNWAIELTDRRDAGSRGRSVSMPAELPPPTTPREATKGGITFDVTHPDDGERRRVTIHQRTRERYLARETIDMGLIGWTPAPHELPRGRWPGSGECRETCGESIPALCCPDCGHVREVGACCHESHCPRCWRSWCLKRTKPAALNVSAYARARGVNDPNTKRHHLTVSFPPDVSFGCEDALSAGFEVVRRIMRLLDVEAGYMVYHPYRIAEEYRGKVVGHESGSGDMKPADVLGKVASDSWTWEAVESELLTFTPHFHVVGITPFAQCDAVTGDVYDRTGIITHRITPPNSKVSIDYGEAPTAGVLAYNLSHCGLIEGEGQTRQPICRFGRFDQLKTDKIKSEIGAAIRAVSQRVVGIELPSGECSAPVPADRESGRSFVPTQSGSIGEGLARAELADAESANTARCGGSYISIRQASQYLDLGPGWEILPDRRERVRQAVDRWNRFCEQSGIEPTAAAPSFSPADD